VRVLLDTHVLLWWLQESPRLTSVLRDAIGDPSNEVIVSAVSHAEIAIKRSLGKLEAPWIPDELLVENGMGTLPFTSAHGRRLLDLPFHHKDPFDRMLVAQAAVEGLAFATADPRLSAYDIPLLGAA
jgi:PIN domain nuclease of toxin-antitoxin system